MKNQSKKPLGRPKKVSDEFSTKDKILFFATDLFLDKGFTLVSMDDVAKQSNVTKATVYYYYKTKTDLFTDAMVQLMVRIKQQIVRILSAEESLRLRLFKLAKAYIEATVDIDINSFMKEAKISLSDEQMLLMKASEDEVYSTLEEALQNEMDKGFIPRSNAKLQSVAFVSLLTATKNVDTDQSSDQLITEMLELFLYGITGEK